MPHSRKIKLILQGIAYLLMLSFACWHLGKYSQANQDLREGRFALFMDEQITFDQLEKLRTATSSRLQWDAFVEGDQRYGRIMLYPAFLLHFMTKGQLSVSDWIYAYRMIQAVLLISAMLLGALFLVEGAVQQLICYSALASLQWTAYYGVMPKPEPIQFFMLALFLIVFKRKSRLSRTSVFFLGQAFAAKISLFFFVIGLGTWTFLRDFLDRSSWFQLFKRHSGLIFGFLLGWVGGVPLLYYGRVGEYVNNTFRNLRHDDNQSFISVWSWVEMLASNFGHSSFWGLQFLFYLVALGVVWLFLKQWRNNSLGGMLLAVSLGYLVPVILFSKRAWPMYLHGGLFFYLIFICHILSGFRMSGRWRLAKPLLWLPLILYSYNGITKFSDEIDIFANRSKSPEYLEQIASMKSLEDFLTKNHVKGPVWINANLFIPPKVEGVEFLQAFGIFDKWSWDFPAVVTFRQSFEEETSKLPGPEFPAAHLAALKARQEYSNHVSAKGVPCKQAPCYYLAQEEPLARFYLKNEAP